ncbi:MAG: twin-arginine translocase TatA/TatE family subunit [Nitrospirae bacterium]|nr:twin-arginine translocase TatA/TatE family subunit [Nitrospirota bacterium]MBI5096329.1 twin-arginine translocase TatA/TatE family subunit [Nitrospirota bacterium]
MGNLGIPELLIILVIVMIIFGVGKLSQIGEGLGKAISGFKRGLSEGSKIEDVKQENEKKEKGG